jgi:1-acyl-sn-glycerol-3-phosphate acyltransferase
MKSINSHCICGLHTGYKLESLYVILPCEHIVHQKCYWKLKYTIPKKKDSKLVCPICFTLIQNVISESTIDQLTKQGNTSAFEIWKDMRALRFYDNNYSSKEMFFHRMPKLFYTIMQIKNTPSEEKEKIRSLCKNMCDHLNVNIDIVDKHLDIDIPKIYIANHSCFLDSFVLNMVLQCGFLGSGKQITNNMFSDILPKLVPLLHVERGKSNKNVDKIKDFIKENKKLCIYPEGMQTALNTLGQFRTGAFYAGFPIQPVVIEYTNVYAHYEDVGGFVYRLLAQDLHHPIGAKVTFLDVIHPPFNVDYIVEKTRLDMAMVGNFYLSRVSNREIKD